MLPTAHAQAPSTGTEPHFEIGCAPMRFLRVDAAVAHSLFGCPPEALYGAGGFLRWLARLHPPCRRHYQEHIWPHALAQLPVLALHPGKRLRLTCTLRRFLKGHSAGALLQQITFDGPHRASGTWQQVADALPDAERRFEIDLVDGPVCVNLLQATYRYPFAPHRAALPGRREPRPPHPLHPDPSGAEVARRLGLRAPTPNVHPAPHASSEQPGRGGDAG